MAEGAGKQRGASGSSSKTAKAVKPDQNGRVETNAAQNMTDLEFLRGLIDAVDQSGIDSLEINRAGTRIRIAKTPAAPAQATAYPAFAAPAAPPMATAPVASSPAGAAAPLQAGSAEPQSTAAGAASGGAASTAASDLIDVKSPMVGTFYRAPAPEAPPYVEVGSTVGKGQTLCILEAMKLMNELECEQEGVIREILVEDADPVEYGQVLFRIQPS